MSFLSNPKIATTIVERVPCAFAPAVNGKMGTHYVAIMLDKDRNVLYMNCECLEKHEEGVVATMHETGGGTCYEAIHVLKQVYARKYPDYNYSVPETLTRVINDARTRCSRVRGERENSFMEPTSLEQVARILTRNVRVVTGSPLFTVNADSASRSLFINLKKADGYRLEVANRTLTGTKWFTQISDMPYWGRRVWKHRADDFCVVCGKHYERMGMHTKSAAHTKNLEKQVNRALKFSVSHGLEAVQQRGALFFREKNPAAKRRRAALIKHCQDQRHCEPRSREVALYHSRQDFSALAARQYADRVRLPLDVAESVLQTVSPISYT